MAEKRAKENEPIRLSVRSVEKVLVEPEDEDRFCVTSREAARACQQMENDKEWKERFDQFLLHLQHWGKEHAVRVNSILVDIGDGSLSVMVCTPGEEYDFGIDDELSGLDIEIVQKFPWCVAEVMQIPGKVKDGQLSLEKAILVYGDGSRASEASRS